MTEIVIVATDHKGNRICPECMNTGYVDPFAEDADYPCPECSPEAYQSADEYFAISDALGLRRELDGFSRERLLRAEKSYLEEVSFGERSRQFQQNERKRTGAW